MVDGASILDFASGPQKVRNGPGDIMTSISYKRRQDRDQEA
jgi:hypothetical protein